MALPQIVSRQEWLAARKALLAKEKAMTRARDALNTERRMLPMVLIEKDYQFEGPEGKANLLDLFEGRHQLILGHFMFDPRWEKGCPGCSAGADEVSDGLLAHLHKRGSDFNYDFDVTIDERVKPAVYNYKTLEEHEKDGSGYYFQGERPLEQPGTSFFLRDGDRIFHTYSTFGRGAEMFGGSYYWLDLTALGRQEAWEHPKDRADFARSASPTFEN